MEWKVVFFVKKIPGEASLLQIEPSESLQEEVRTQSSGSEGVSLTQTLPTGASLHYSLYYWFTFQLVLLKLFLCCSLKSEIGNPAHLGPVRSMVQRCLSASPVLIIRFALGWHSDKRPNRGYQSNISRKETPCKGIWGISFSLPSCSCLWQSQKWHGPHADFFIWVEESN